MAKIKEIDADKTKKTKVILKRKTQIWTNPRKQFRKKKYFEQQVFE